MVVKEGITERKHAEEALRESVELFRSVIQTAYDAIIVINSYGNIVFWNRAAETMFGYSADEIVGKPLIFIMPERFREDHTKGLNRVVSTGKTKIIGKPFETLGLRRDGSEFPIEFYVATCKMGEATFFSAIVRDVTERIEMQEDLRNVHKELLDILEFLPDATFVIDQDKKVIAWNQAMEEMTGIRKEDIIGKGDYAYAVPFYGVRRPILIDLIFLSDEEIESRYKYVKREGNALFAETFISSLYGGKGAYLWGNATPLIDSKGNIVGAIESIRDITERKQAEDKLKKSEQEYRSLVESTEDSVYLVDRDCRYLFLNDKHLSRLGLPAEKIVGRTYSEFHSPEEEKEFAKIVDQVFKTGKSVLHEHRSRKDNRYILRTLSPVKDSEGRVTAVTVVSKDITERKKMEEEIKREKEFLGNLIRESPTAILSTDLNGNVVVINKSAEELLGYKGDEIIGKPLSMMISGRMELEIADKRDFPINFVKKDGTEIPLNVSTSVQLSDGEQRGLIVTLKDLSELRGLFITPVSEVSVEAEMKYHLEQGFMYLIEEEKPEKCFDVFTDSVKHGSPGLFISRQKPALIREKYQLEKTPNIWLTRNKVPGENCISPDELAKLYKTIENFIRHVDDGVILFEGLEYLIAQNGFQPVLKFIQSVNDLIMVHPSRLIVAVDPLTMDTRELHIVRRDMRTI